MTREEAISQLKLLNEEPCIYSGAISYAIKALEVEPCEDAVSRADVVDMLEMYPFTEYGEYESAREAVKRLPSAQPEIIRCKDCKYGSPNGNYGCKCYHYRLYETHEMKPEDFCSHAERRTDE